MWVEGGDGRQSGLGSRGGSDPVSLAVERDSTSKGLVSDAKGLDGPFPLLTSTKERGGPCSGLDADRWVEGDQGVYEPGSDRVSPGIV